MRLKELLENTASRVSTLDLVSERIVYQGTPGKFETKKDYTVCWIQPSGDVLLINVR